MQVGLPNECVHRIGREARLPVNLRYHFEWDETKDVENQAKHNVPFSVAQHAFLDPSRIIVEDITHSSRRRIDFTASVASTMA